MYTQPFNIKTITLKASNRQVMRYFYEELLGFYLAEETEDTLSYSFREKEVPFLKLEFGGMTPTEKSTGLFHYAILFPDRASKAGLIEQLMKANYPLGAGDHLVSESFYLSDPEGNGIELYHDRDPETWKWDEGKVEMGTFAVDVEAVLATKEEGTFSYPEKMSIGHLHFTGNSLALADKLFIDMLQTDLVARVGNTAHFYSQNHYHHHFATNLWEGTRLKKRNLQENGILAWEIEVGREYYEAVLKRVVAAGRDYEVRSKSIILEDHVGAQLVITEI
ncbi:glyoxalase [Lactococcus formosensis]|uniref:Glyoxalase n=1 Tax=Lactococcus formosensis TaxID=1281486 RepID=A0A9X4P1M9_9LACT|nr:glyoxalase [Lactococcus formosensis]MDG6112337.1 glyoxalase [Lactococcus formosensis]MDG6118602.1 glyoxalase [Lactococcus formosensis]MDG6126307.1 glyoxalase [Lactococcus formosensis]MDG6133416.1 glyoxalase [Lactococcus formosensis]MDG6135413.1 glyoxalase [Lactococcus formosensis]